MSNGSMCSRGAMTLGLIASLWFSVMRAEAALVVGDVVILGINSDNPDAIAWAPLVNLAAGQTLYFSDAGWIGGSFSGSAGATRDGLLRYTVPTGGLSAGTIVGADGSGLGSDYEAIGGPPGPLFSLLTSGDQVVVFSGTPESPEFLFGLNFAGATWNEDVGSRSANIRTGLYPGLEIGRTAVAIGTGPSQGLEFDNARYLGPLTGTRAELLGWIADPNRWEGIDQSGTSDRFSPLLSGTHLTLTAPSSDPPAASTVPEPSTWVTWITLLGGAAIVRRRRRNRQLAGS